MVHLIEFKYQNKLLQPVNLQHLMGHFRWHLISMRKRMYLTGERFTPIPDFTQAVGS